MANQKSDKGDGATATAVKSSIASKANKRATIEICNSEKWVNDQVLAALAEDEKLYYRGARLVQSLRGITGQMVREIPSGTMREIIAMRVNFIKKKFGSDGKETITTAHVPDWCTRAILDRGHWPGLRELRGVIEHPVILPNGEILTKKGYDPETGLLLIWDEQLKVPRKPTKKQVYAALELLNECICDFPFLDLVGKSAWLASLFTVLARHSFQGPAPLFLADANVRGSGKSMLGKMVHLICCGRPAPTTTWPDEIAEKRKLVFSCAISGTEILFLDNLEGNFGDAFINQALTSTSMFDRTMRTQTMVEVPLQTVWLASGNNLNLVGDVGRRICQIRLESPLEKPETRSGFRHPNLLGWVAERRLDLLEAALTVLRHYHVAGRPDQKLSNWGSYEEWSEAIRAPIVYHDLPDPYQCSETMEDAGDEEAALIQSLMECLLNMDPEGKGFTTSQILDGDFNLSNTEDAAEVSQILRDLSKNMTTTYLGHLFRSYRRRNLGGFVLDKAKRIKGTNRWKVTRIENDFPSED